jgi:hypothetical protein
MLVAGSPECTLHRARREARASIGGVNDLLGG